MQEPPTKLDALSEMMALSSYGNTKNRLVTAVEVKGPVDEEALKRAVQLAAKGFPQLVSRIREIKEGGRYHLAWDHDPDMNVPLRTTHHTRCGSIRARSGRISSAHEALPGQRLGSF